MATCTRVGRYRCPSEEQSHEETESYREQGFSGLGQGFYGLELSWKQTTLEERTVDALGHLK